MTPMFSVVIPTYNQAEFLKVALKSVLDQTLQDFEIVVVNNESTDSTPEVVRQFQEEDVRIQAIDFQDSHVIGAVRNAGIRASQGDYVAFLDSDDTWYPNKLEKVAEAISATPKVGLIGHDEEMVREGSTAIRSKAGPPEEYRGDIHDYLLFKSNFVALSAAVVARTHLNAVENFSEDPSINTVEDYDLWLKLSKVCHFEFIPEVLGVHNDHEASASTNVEVQLKALLAVLDKHFNEHQSPRWFHMKKARRQQDSNAYFAAARQYQRRGAVIKPIGHYFRTIKAYPFHLRAYAGLGLLAIDMVLGQRKRQKLAQAFWPGGRLASW